MKNKAIKSIMADDDVSMDEAQKIYEAISLRSYEYKIIGKSIVLDRLFIDPITRKPLKGTRYTKSLNMQFGERGETHNLHIFGNNFQAIVTSYTTIGESSIIKVRFGKCAIINWAVLALLLAIFKLQPFCVSTCLLPTQNLLTKNIADPAGFDVGGVVDLVDPVHEA